MEEKRSDKMRRYAKQLLDEAKTALEHENYDLYNSLTSQAEIMQREAISLEEEGL